jgi:hypothetical protein
MPSSTNIQGPTLKALMADWLALGTSEMRLSPKGVKDGVACF